MTILKTIVSSLEGAKFLAKAAYDEIKSYDKKSCDLISRHAGGSLLTVVAAGAGWGGVSFPCCPCSCAWYFVTELTFILLDRNITSVLLGSPVRQLMQHSTTLQEQFGGPRRQHLLLQVVPTNGLCSRLGMIGIRTTIRRVHSMESKGWTSSTMMHSKQSTRTLSDSIRR